MKIDINTPNVHKFLDAYYNSLNAILNLTYKQLEVLKSINYYYIVYNDGDINNEELDYKVFSKETRKLITKDLIMSSENLNNIIQILKREHILLVDNKDSKKTRISLNPRLLIKSPKSIEITYNIIYG